MSADDKQTSSIGGEIVAVISALVAVVGPEIVKAIVGHGADTAPIPEDVRATVRAIIYPMGGSKLASEIEHEADLAALAKAQQAGG